MASLVTDPNSIKASLCSYDPFNSETTWTAHLLTGAALAVAQVKFDVRNYNGAEEHRRELERAFQPGYEVTQAWARPLAGITSYHPSFRKRGEEFSGPGPVQLAFVRLVFDSCGQFVNLPYQMSDEFEQERSDKLDKFVCELRKSIGWLA